MAVMRVWIDLIDAGLVEIIIPADGHARRSVLGE
jgi:hypothetical protein